MAFTDKVAENKMAAEKCLTFGAYNAGVTRAYYSAFLHIKSYLIKNGFNYTEFLKQNNSVDREFSHGTLRSATVKCLMANGKKPADVCKLTVLSDMYKKRIIADYTRENILESELKVSLQNLKTVLLVVS